jgi:cholinesterase
MSPVKFEVVDTQYGPVKGVQKSSVLGRNYLSFQGIPYMKAPIGKLRFRDAQPPETWSEPFDATQEPASFCISNFLNYKIEGKEDAGVINVYTPYLKTEKPLPVMVWIHGGGFASGKEGLTWKSINQKHLLLMHQLRISSGSSKTDVHGPDFFMQKDVVIVTFNYRLGPIGFLSLEDPKVNVPGNAGLKDQNFALKWVHKNIANFNGDVNNITLFGTSAGSASVHYQMISEQSRGLFHRSIVMSGCAFNSCFALIPRRDFAQRLAKALGWDGTGGDKAILELLELVEAEKIVDASQSLLTAEEEYGENLMIPFGPTIEPYVSGNCFVPEHPTILGKKAWSNGIDSIIGVTSFEGLFRAYSDITKAANTLQNFDYFTPLRQLNVDVPKDKISEYGTKIKEIYYGKMRPTATNVEPYYHVSYRQLQLSSLTFLFQYMSDVYFLHGLQRAILSRVNANAGGRTFFYRFDCDTGLNLIKNLINCKNFDGAAHWDDLGYFWWTDPEFNLIGELNIDKELKLVNQMTNLLTSFAIEGTPDAGTIAWDPITSVERPLKCLSISDKPFEVIDFPEAEKLKVWDEIFADANAELF